MLQTVADVDEVFVDDSADGGSTSDSSSEEDDSEAVTLYIYAWHLPCCLERQPPRIRHSDPSE